ncbi:glycoside hydrolase family 25 protein, partial [Herbaspirillum sp. B65]
WMVDMSSNNSAVILNKGAVFGDSNTYIKLVIHRVTIGSYAPPKFNGDPLFQARSREAYDAGIYFGAYHVAYPSTDAISQAKGFLSAVSEQCIAQQKIILAVDWEHVCSKWKVAGKKKICSAEQIVQPSFINAFVKEVISITGVTPIIYTSPRTLREFTSYFHSNEDAREFLSSMPLWIARYRSPTGHVFPTDGEMYPWNDWVFWQFAEGKGAGPTKRVSLKIGNEPVDTNYYNGERTEIEGFYAKHAWTCKRPG